jgi:pyruvate dehydrogenase E2 component (dihydrolipoamide acetyltransferase)
MGTQVEVRVPDIGDFKDVEIIEVAVAAGDRIEVDGTLVTLETEKATMDVPSTVAGRVRELKVSRGGRVSQGDLVAIVEVEAGAGAEDSPAEASPAAQLSATATVPAAPSPVTAVPAPPPAATRAAAAPSPPATTVVPAAAPLLAEAGFSRSHASPSIRRFARELGVDLARVQGTGTKGRITEQDVKAWVKRALIAPAPAGGGALPRVPVVDFAAFGPVERVPLTRIQRISGPRLHASWVNLPHVTQFDEADITDMEAARQGLKDEAAARGIKLTPLAFVMRACAQALAAFPHFGASLDAEAGELVMKKYLHLGFAADTPNGLVVPVVRDADRKDVFELARELAALSDKARAGKLAAAEMQGGCFTVSSLGGIGGTAFTPIINAPEVAILGVSRATQRPVLDNGAWVPRLMLPLSLSYDHRVIDGADAVRFTSFLAKALADVEGLLRAIP